MAPAPYAAGINNICSSIESSSSEGENVPVVCAPGSRNFKLDEAAPGPPHNPNPLPNDVERNEHEDTVDLAM